MGKALLLGMLLVVAMPGRAQSGEEAIVSSTNMLADFCAERYPDLKGLPARLAVEARPEERAALKRAQADPKAGTDRTEGMKQLAETSPEDAATLCHGLADAPKGGMYSDVRERMMLNTLESEYPAVVQEGVEEFKHARPDEQAVVANRLLETLAHDGADDIMRGRITQAFAALGPGANVASASLKQAILRSAKGLPPSSQTVPLDKPLRSGGMVSDSATVTTDSSGEAFDSAFEILGQMKPAPVATLCELLADPNRKVQARARQEMDSAKVPIGSCPK